MRLQGKVAIVTGGASGIGEATVRLFAAEGAKVVVADQSQQGAALAAELGRNGYPVLFQRTDVTQEADIGELLRVTVERFGRLDIMVANAGIADDPVASEEMDLPRWQRLLDINLTGVFLSCRDAIAQMRRQGDGGAVVNIASVLGHVGRAGVASYNAAKGGVVNLTRSLAVECAKDGIRVNAVCPGFVDTPILDRIGDEARGRIAAAHPIGRLGRAEEIARAILFLASDEASFVVGANLLVDGGYTAQ